MRPQPWCFALLIGLVTLFAAIPSAADERAYFSAYITQAYMRAIKNEPRGIDQKGTFDATSYSLNLRFAASDSLTLATELAAKTWAILDLDNSTSLDPELKVASGTWRFGDSLRISAGIQRAPLGIYGEVRDLGIAVQTFMPVLYQPTTGLAPEAFRGLSLAWYGNMGGMSLDAQLFFGELQTPAYEADPIAMVRYFLGGDRRLIAEQRLRNTVGGRLSVGLLDEAILLSASGYSGHNYDGELRTDQESNSWIASMRLQQWGMQLRGEYAVWNRNAPLLDGAITTWNLYGAVELGGYVTLYLNWDNAMLAEEMLSQESLAQLTEIYGPQIIQELDPAQIPQLMDIATGRVDNDQEMLSIGLDWRPSPEISIKLEDYMMKGTLLVPDLEHYDEFAHTLVVSVSYTYQ